MSALPNVGSGPGGQATMTLLALVLAGLVAAAGAVVVRKRGVM